jgi:hypothetical protein
MLLKAVLQPVFLIVMLLVPENRPKLAIVGCIGNFAINLIIALAEIVGFLSRKNHDGVIGFVLTAILSESAFWTWKIFSLLEWNKNGGKINTDLWWIDLVQILVLLAVGGVSFLFCGRNEYKNWIHAGYTTWYFPVLKILRFLIFARFMGLIETHIALLFLPITVVVSIFALPSVLLVVRALIILVRFEFSQFKSFTMMYETSLGVFTLSSGLILIFANDNLKDSSKHKEVLTVALSLIALTLLWPCIFLWRIDKTADVGANLRREFSTELRERAKQYAKAANGGTNYPEQNTQV